MAILFRPVISIDHDRWTPVLKETFSGLDLRIGAENARDPAEIEYLIGWKLFPGDATGWPNLKAVLSLGAGVNQFVGHPEFPRGAALIRMIEPGLSQAMAEYVASYVLRFHREHDHMETLCRAPWSRTIPKLAPERSVGILGLGEMGAGCAVALKQLGFRLRGWSRSARVIEGVECFAGFDALNDFLSGTDILVCLLPLTPETKGILNRDTLSRLPRGACLINAGRGPHLVEDDLIPLLDAGHLDQAALDVFHTEPLPAGHPFYGHKRIHVTPHLAAVTIPETGAVALRESILALQRGERPAGWVDVNRGY